MGLFSNIKNNLKGGENDGNGKILSSSISVVSNSSSYSDKAANIKNLEKEQPSQSENSLPSDSNLEDLEKKALEKNAKLVTESGNMITKDGQVVIVTNESDNIFRDPEIAKYYSQIYEEVKYECRHEFDPNAEWTEKEEKKLVRKLDLRVCLWACIMFFALQLDRGNLSQAVSDNLLDDLGITTDNFNTGNTIFYCCFLATELPLQLVSKKIGPDRWLPTQMIMWSLVSASQAALKGKGGFYATRCLIGALEGSFIAEIVLWLSYFYNSKELPIRLSFFWTSLSLTQIASSLAAFGLLRMRGLHGLAGWRWLFLIEGIITFTVGVLSYFNMPASVVQTKSRFRPKGWFTDREVKIAVNRILRDDPMKGEMNNRQPLDWAALWDSLKDYDLWILYAIGLVAYIPNAPQSTYLTLTLKKLGFSTFNTNLLTIPGPALNIISLLTTTKLSQVFKEKSLICLSQPIFFIPFLVALRWWPGTQVDVWPTYVLLTLLIGGPYIHAILVAWCSENSNTVRTRTVSASLYNMFVQAGSIISNNMYRDDDKPLYYRGNMQLFAINFITIALLLFCKVYYVKRNNWKKRKLESMTNEEKYIYLSTTTDKGNKRLDFMFAH